MHISPSMLGIVNLPLRKNFKKCLQYDNCLNLLLFLIIKKKTLGLARLSLRCLSWMLLSSVPQVGPCYKCAMKVYEVGKEKLKEGIALFYSRHLAFLTSSSCTISPISFLASKTLKPWQCFKLMVFSSRCYHLQVKYWEIMKIDCHGEKLYSSSNFMVFTCNELVG